jgi:3-oxoadipate enol-lactonase
MKLKLNSISFYYEDLGAGIPMVFLHGFPLGHTIWNGVTPLLVNHFRLILPDLRGHGLSDCPEGHYRMPLIADDIAGLMDYLGMDKAILVGHSMGGYASLAFALKYPERLIGIGLIATQAGADSPEQKVGRYSTIEAVNRDGITNLADTMSQRLTSRPDLIPIIRAMILATCPVGVIGSLQGLAERLDVSGELSKIQAPAVVVAGDADKIIPLERSQEMARMLPLGSLVIIPGAGHMPMMEAPQAVAEALIGLIMFD